MDHRQQHLCIKMKFYCNEGPWCLKSHGKNQNNICQVNHEIWSILAVYSGCATEEFFLFVLFKCSQMFIESVFSTYIHALAHLNLDIIHIFSSKKKRKHQLQCDKAFFCDRSKQSMSYGIKLIYVWKKNLKSVMCVCVFAYFSYLVCP